MLIQRINYEVNLDSLRILAVQSAAVVLFICKKRSPVIESDFSDAWRLDPISHELNKYVNWSIEDHINSLQSMVEVIYDLVRTLVDDESRTDVYFGKGEREIIAEALRTYQDWKTKYIAAVKEQQGMKNWGDTTMFNKMDWTEFNEAFLYKAKIF